MQAVRFHDYGGPEELVLDEVARPETQAGEVLVRIHAAGVNPIDWKMRRGIFKNVRPLPLPFIPGSELAGTVAALGPGVTSLQVGQAVYGRGGKGTYAEYCVIPADSLAPSPRNISFDQAAAVPVGARTAWIALFNLADLQAGQTVLVQGAAGGVGSYAVQLARWKGATVIATASAANLDFVRGLGADTVIDYTATRFETVAHDVDVVLELVGGDTQTRSWSVIKPGGILVAVGSPPDEAAAAQHGVRAASTVLDQRNPIKITTEPLIEITALIEAGTLIAEPGRVFPLREAAQAQALSESGHGRGRIILHIAD